MQTSNPDRHGQALACVVLVRKGVELERQYTDG